MTALSSLSSTTPEVEETVALPAEGASSGKASSARESSGWSTMVNSRVTLRWSLGGSDGTVMFSGTVMAPPSRSTVMTSSKSATSGSCVELTPMTNGVGVASTSRREEGRTGMKTWE